MDFIDIHTHNQLGDEGIVKIHNIYPGDGFAAFSGRNYYSVGLHPWHIKSSEENQVAINFVEKALSFEHVIAIGECGLDKIASTNYADQKQVFLQQVNLSEKYNKPLVIHNVKAIDDLLNQKKLSGASLPWLIHGYNSSKETAFQLIKNGFYLSFGSRLFQEESKAVASFKAVPLNYAFLETDEHDGTVAQIYERAAELREINLQELKRQIAQNFKNVFGKE